MGDGGKELTNMPHLPPVAVGLALFHFEHLTICFRIGFAQSSKAFFNRHTRVRELARHLVCFQKSLFLQNAMRASVGIDPAVRSLS